MLRVSWLLAAMAQLAPSPAPPLEEPPPPGSPRGHLVGCAMIDVGNMEGDERIEVDGRSASEYHGTGTEDYLNFAWGLSHRASFPLHGLNASSTATGGHANGYRFHLTDAVPFRESIRFTVEHWDEGRYRGVVFWYEAR